MALSQPHKQWFSNDEIDEATEDFINEDLLESGGFSCSAAPWSSYNNAIAYNHLEDDEKSAERKQWSESDGAFVQGIDRYTSILAPSSTISG